MPWKLFLLVLLLAAWALALLIRIRPGTLSGNARLLLRLHELFRD